MAFVPGKFREAVFLYRDLSWDLGDLLAGDYTLGVWTHDPEITGDMERTETTVIPIDLASGLHNGTEVVDGSLQLESFDNTIYPLIPGLYASENGSSGC